MGILDALHRKRAMQVQADTAMASGRCIALNLVNKQYERLRVENFNFDFNMTIMRDIEVKFLLGLFTSHAEKFQLPTAVEHRAQIHLIDYLVNHHGIDFDSARTYAVDIHQQLLNKEFLTAEIFDLGRTAYTEQGDWYFVVVVSSLHKSGMKQPAYSRGQSLVE